MNEEHDFLVSALDELSERIDHLKELKKSSRHQEAFILCLVYIDQLASECYGNGEERNKQNFCQALRELGNDPLFSKIHSRELMEQAQQFKPEVVPALKDLVEDSPSHLICEKEVRNRIAASKLPLEIEKCLSDNLWRASVAAVVYKRLRCSAVHELGWNLSIVFDASESASHPETRIDFDRLHKALRSVFEAVRAKSMAALAMP